MQGLVPQRLTPTTVSIPRDGGGIVVALRSASRATQEMPAGVQLTRGRRTQDLVGRALAPGLVRFASVTRLTTGTWTAAALGPDASVIVGRRDPMPGVPTRPVVTELRRLAATSSGRSAPRTEIRATLEFPVPAGIVAILTYWGDEGAAPAAWEPVIQGQRDVVIWQQTPACESDPAGRTGPPEGPTTTARIAYVDQFGQVSPPSAPVAVR